MKFLAIALACLMAVPTFAEEEPLEFTGYWDTVRKSVIPEIPIQGTLEDTTGDLTKN